MPTSRSKPVSVAPSKDNSSTKGTRLLKPSTITRRVETAEGHARTADRTRAGNRIDNSSINQTRKLPTKESRLKKPQTSNNNRGDGSKSAINTVAARRRSPEKVISSRQRDYTRNDGSQTKITRIKETVEVERSRTPRNSVVITGDNNIYVAGDYTVTSPDRPYIPSTLCNDNIYVRSNRHWYNHGNFFSWRWSPYSCGRVTYLNYGSHYGMSYYYPNYHRKYVFVSIGGYWPHRYRYRRYYWYGCHPHRWYDTPVIVQQPAVENTYNTYNYYYDQQQPQQQVSYDYDYSYDQQGTLGDFSDVRERMLLQKAKQQFNDEPEYETAADMCFGQGVDSFNKGNYDEAVNHFREAILLSPDDEILPFTYCQALFANGDYALAASVLRSALKEIPDEGATIYFPRGLYPEQDLLKEQIESLEAAAKKEPFNSDLILLAGYQLVGLGETERATGHLLEASGNMANEATAGTLLELIAKLEEEAQVSE